MYAIVVPSIIRNVVRKEEKENRRRNVDRCERSFIVYILHFLRYFGYLFILIVFCILGENVSYSWDVRLGIKSEYGVIGIVSENKGLFFDVVMPSIYWGMKSPANIWVSLSPDGMMHNSCPKEFVHSWLVKMLLKMDLCLKQDIASLLEVDTFSGSLDDIGRVYVTVDKVNVVRKKDFLSMVSVYLSVHLDGFDFLQNGVKRGVERKLTYSVNNSQKYFPLRAVVSGWAVGRLLRRYFGDELFFPFTEGVGSFSQWDVIEDYLLSWRDKGTVVGAIILDDDAINVSDSLVGNGSSFVYKDSSPRAVILGRFPVLVLSSFREMPVVISDMDGTLTEKGAPIDDKKARILFSFMKNGGKFIVVTGSDFEKVVRTIGNPLLKIAQLERKEGVLNNFVIISESGSYGYTFSDGKVKLIYRLGYIEGCKDEVISIMKRVMRDKNIPIREGDTLLVRRGSFCIYLHSIRDVLGDRKDELRKDIASFLNQEFKKRGLEVEAFIAGDFSVDVTLKGGKSVALDEIERMGIDLQRAIYLGDSLYEGGNDEVAIGRVRLCVDVSGRRKEENVFPMVGGIDKSYEVINTLMELFVNKSWLASWRDIMKEDFKGEDVIRLLKDVGSAPSEIREILVREILVDMLRRYLRNSNGVRREILSGHIEENKGSFNKIAVLGGGTGLSKFWLDIFSKFGMSPENFSVFVHNLDDGGSSIEIIQSMELKGFDFPYPLGDIAGILFGGGSDWVKELFQDFVRIDTSDLFENVCLRLVDVISNYYVDGKDDEDKIFWILSIMDFLEQIGKRYVQLLPKGQISLRNAIIWGLYLWEMDIDKDIDNAMRMNSVLTFLSNMFGKGIQVRYITNDKLTLMVRRPDWTIKIVDKDKVFWIGLLKRNGRVYYRIVSDRGMQRGELKEGNNFLLNGEVKISYRGEEIVLLDRVVLKEGGLSPFVEIDGKKIPLTIDGSGRRRVSQVSGDDIPVMEIDGVKLYVNADVTIMQTNITETFSPLSPVELRFLNVGSKIPYKVYNGVGEAKVLAKAENANISLDGIKMVMIGPGSFWTSVLPYFGFRKVVEELVKVRKSGGKVILCFGAMVDNETFGMSVLDCIKAIEDLSGERIHKLVDIIVVPEGKMQLDFSVFGDEKILGNLIGVKRSPVDVSVAGKLGYGNFGITEEEESKLSEMGIDVIKVKVDEVECIGRDGSTIVRLMYDVEDGYRKLLPYVRNVVVSKEDKDDIGKSVDIKAIEELIFKVRESGGVDSGLNLLSEVLKGNLDLDSSQDVLDLWEDLIDYMRSWNIAGISSFVKEMDEGCLFKIDEIQRALSWFTSSMEGEDFTTKAICLGMILSELGADGFVREFFRVVSKVSDFEIKVIKEDVIISVSKELFRLSDLRQDKGAGGIYCPFGGDAAYVSQDK